MMHANGFMTADHVLLDAACGSKDEALDLLARTAADLGIAISYDGVRSAFEVREREGSTGMMDGFAVHHAKTDAIRRASVIILRSEAGIKDWETIDGSEVGVAIALLVPDGEAGTTHIDLLAHVARALMDEAFRDGIRDARESGDVSDLVNRRLAI